MKRPTGAEPGPVRRLLVSFLVRAALLLILLLLPWPGLGRTFSRAVAALHNAALSDPTSSVDLAFKVPEDGAEGGPWQVHATARQRETNRVVGTALDTRRAGYLHDATFVALTLATRAPRKPKLKILIVGLLLLLVVPLLPTLAFFSGSELGIKAFDLHPITQSVVQIAYRVLIAAPGMAYASAGLLWLLLVRVFASEVL
ncbi:MAG TPA: hypothetical protein VJN18_24965 [Polyangiaceae bacterium]|nr:hypothetical protein [Polyangiaceae bacterium]